MIGLNHYLVLGALLFVCGVVCMAIKRNAIGVLMGVELVLNGANINFVAFSRFNPVFKVEGQVFALHAASGKPLWRYEAGGAARSNPISYSVDGKQHVAVAIGNSLLSFGME